MDIFSVLALLVGISQCVVWCGVVWLVGGGNFIFINDVLQLLFHLQHAKRPQLHWKNDPCIPGLIRASSVH